MQSLGQFHPTDAWKNNEVACPVGGDLEHWNDDKLHTLLSANAMI